MVSTPTQHRKSLAAFATHLVKHEILVAKVYAVDADKNDMKQFFQGLVLGAALMYGYLYHSAGLLARLQNWFGYIAGQYREDRHSQEAEKALHGFLLRRDLRLMDEESTRG